MKFYPKRAKPGARMAGWTLPELMVAVSVGTLVLAAVSSTFVFMRRTLDATINYEELDRQSRFSLDQMSSDIRQCGGMTAYSTNSISFTNVDGSLLRFTWDTTNFLSYTNASTNLQGCPRGGILLKGCNSLIFTIFQRNPVPGTTMTFTPCASTNLPLVKVVVMDWTCQRTNFLTLKNTESVQTAKVVLRN